VALNAVVLAGGPLDDIARLQPGAPNKAFVEIGGTTLVGRVLGALRGCVAIERIVVVAPESEWGNPALRDADDFRPDGVHISESLRNGIAGFPADDALLVVASDMPVLTPRIACDFVARVEATEADVIYGCVEKNSHLARFPRVPHTWARMRDGTYCGAGMFALKPRALPVLERFIEELGAARKSPLRLASLFGWDMLARFALGRLSVAQAEARATKILGAPVRALISPYPETAVNVDRVSYVALARERVSSESASA
jgi:molybdopterin-guanine dinucleotide biosynthesis protein A